MATECFKLLPLHSMKQLKFKIKLATSKERMWYIKNVDMLFLRCLRSGNTKQ